MAEERSVPEMTTILDDANSMHERLDAGIAAAGGDPARVATFLATFLQNDLMPLLKDQVESTLYALEDLQDLADPVTIPGRLAQENADLLLALKAQNSGNPEMVSRIDEVLEHLIDGDGEENDEEDEG